MTTIDLTKEQVEELRSFYKLELEKSSKRTNEIIAILHKLESKPESTTQPAVQEFKPEKKTEVVVSKEENKYIKWSDTILELLNEKQKPLSFKEIVKILTIQKNIPKSDLKKTDYAIRQSIYRLRTINKKIQSIKKGSNKTQLFGLSDWAINPEIEKTIESHQIKSKPTKSVPEIKQDIKIRTNGKNWQGFIKETLETKKRVLSLGELTNVALKHFELKSNEKTRTKANLAPVLTKLVKNDKILKTTLLKGKNGRSYGLKEWFDESGNLISLYK